MQESKRHDVVRDNSLLLKTALVVNSDHPLPFYSCHSAF